VGLQQAWVGLQQAWVGLQQAWVGLQQVSVDPQLAMAWAEAENQPPAWAPRALLLALRRGAVADLLLQPWGRP